MAQIINRNVEVCGSCGGLMPFRKGQDGRSMYDKKHNCRRIYGRCRHCGARMIVVIRGEK